MSKPPATWGEILQELKVTKELPDGIRRRCLARAAAYTGRDTILYATQWTDGNIDPNLTSITHEDLHGLMEVVHGLKGPNLDFILHSPGGSPHAAEALVHYLRSKFQHIRIIVPMMAMSAATMLACAADSIVMGKHSFLGPIDPQFIISTPTGRQQVPAQAIIEQFRQAQTECADPTKMGAWLPILPQYGPGLLVQCQYARDLSENLVREWLKGHMFAGETDGETKAAEIAKILSDHAQHMSHGRPISRDRAEEIGLKIEQLEKDQEEQDALLAVFHAAAHTFNFTGAVKIMENHLGKAFIKVAGQKVGDQPQRGPKKKKK